MKKRGATLLTVLFALVLFLSVNCTLTARAVTVDDLTYEIVDGEVTITGCNSDASGELIIPATIEGYSVTRIGSMAFSYCTSLTSVTIPDTVTSIGFSAFSYCTSLTSVTIPDTVTSIGDSAFFNCSSLTSVTIPDTVTSIGDSAFQYCSSLTSVTIPDSVTSIGRNTFYHCSGLTSVTIPDSVTNIGDSVFWFCDSLASVTIPDSVTSIEDYTFYHCSGLTSVTIPGSVTSIGDCAFSDCDSLTSVTIPDGVTSIEDSAFSYCNSLTSVTIPDSVTGIGDHAFYGCESLTSVTIPDGVISIGDGVFSYCNSLTSMKIPDSVTSIGNYPFSRCSGLTGICVDDNNICYSSDDSGVLFNKEKTVLIQAPGTISGSYVIPNSVTSIVECAFNGCTNLDSVTIPNSVTNIGDEAFLDCDSLTSVTIPNCVTSIGNHAFSFCDSLTSVTIGDSVICIGDGAFSYSSLTSVTIPDSVTSIGNYPFSDCDSLTGIYVEENNTCYSSDDRGVLFNKEKTALIQAPGTISGSYAIPDSVTCIAECAFDGCTSLTSVTIPDCVTNIGNLAFYYCSGLADVYYSGTQTNWNSISIGDYNSDLTDATIHYNHTHDYSQIEPVTVAATCTEAGYIEYTCVCGECYREDVEALGHSYGKWTVTKAATATAQGSKRRDCTRCDHYQTAVIPKLPAVKTQPANVNLPAGKTAKFTVKATGTGIKYQWQYRTSSKGSWKNTMATGYKTATLSVPVTAARNGYQYRCKITDQEGSVVYSNAATLKVVTLKVTAQPANKYLPAGKTAKFTVKVSGTGLKYQWQYRTSAKGSWKTASGTGSKTATLSVAATASRNGYQYRCKITDKYGNVIYSNAATLKIVTLKITTQPSSVTLAKGKTATFKVVARGTNLKYQWQYRTSAKGAWKNATNTGNKTATLKVPVTAARNGYQYRCVITDKYGNVVGSKAATLKVK